MMFKGGGKPLLTFSEKQKEVIRAPFDVTLEVNEGT